MASFTGASSAPQVNTLERSSADGPANFSPTPWTPKSGTGTHTLNPPSTSGGSGGGGGGSTPPTTGLLWPRTRT